MPVDETPEIHNASRTRASANHNCEVTRRMSRSHAPNKHCEIVVSAMCVARRFRYGGGAEVGEEKKPD